MGKTIQVLLNPETALQIVHKNKIKVYTIGLGSKSGTFPITYKTQNAMREGVFIKEFMSIAESIKN